VPPLPAHPGVLKIRTLFTVGEDTKVATALHYTFTGGPLSDATAVAIATAAQGFAASDLAGAVAVGNAIDGVTVQDLTSDTAGYGEHLVTTAGSRGAGVLPAATCVLLNMPIARRYRGGKPRTYWPWGIDSDLASPQEWSPTAIGDFEAIATTYINHLVGISEGGASLTALVSVSDYQGFTAVQNPITGRWRNVPKPRTVAIAPDTVLTFTVNSRPGSQRRRALHGS